MPKFNVVVIAKTEVLNVDADNESDAEEKVMEMLECGEVCEDEYTFEVKRVKGS